ncbi:hypothetical protein SAMN05216586_10292 [Halopseudomonas aestusnigri]|uniref:Uncharacterized protein n=1 Tax=Halopseudomonas aestusnigri TaxID=857252 RepID=A0AAQ1JP77_9GAMM|nr:hypothetical protein SAMN05216586_10292 [Halopseudomonas aestusnigri]
MKGTLQCGTDTCRCHEFNMGAAAENYKRGNGINDNPAAEPQPENNNAARGRRCSIDCQSSGTALGGCSGVS